MESWRNMYETIYTWIYMRYVLATDVWYLIKVKFWSLILVQVCDERLYLVGGLSQILCKRIDSDRNSLQGEDPWAVLR